MKKTVLLIVFLLLFIASGLSAQDKTEVLLSGINIVPDVHTPATGSAEVWIQSDTLYVKGEFSDLTAPYYAANIHFGEEGETGNPIYLLEPKLSGDQTSGTFAPDENRFALSEAMKQAFENGNLYISIASDQHQTGEIRGQISGF